MAGFVTVEPANLTVFDFVPTGYTFLLAVRRLVSVGADTRVCEEGDVAPLMRLPAVFCL